MVTSDAEKHLKRLHKTTPIIESPLEGADQENLVFSQRHEANSVELFFDLFFVANLATFTAYHSISDNDYLLAYIGFFGILWATWFQITLHDVRFARDSIYERACKTLQFIAFVGLALFYTWRAKYSKLYLPLGLMIGTYAIATGIFGAMIPSYQPGATGPKLLYMVFYGVMVAESIMTVGISCIWRMLSFKKTHLMERMSLLTIIVIGEGAIGVTKTVGRIMGKEIDVEGCFTIMCIIVILVFIWALYFDNFPHGHYGTIRQQIWSLLHFPFQLAIVGVVEGSQQVAMARYVLKNVAKGTKQLKDICLTGSDGAKLQESLVKLADKFQFTSKLETYGYYEDILWHIENIGNATGICSPQNTTSYGASIKDWPEDFRWIDNSIQNGVYSGLGVKMPIKKLEAFKEPIKIAEESWWLTYMYFWSCFCALILSLIVFLILIRRHKADVFDFVSIIVRCLVLGAGGAALTILASPQRLVDILNSPAVLPMAVILMFVVLCSDKLASIWCNWRLVKSGEPYALEYEEEHHGGGHDEHGEAHLTGDEEHGKVHHGRPQMKKNRSSARWSTNPALIDMVKEETAYVSVTGGHYRDSSHDSTHTPPLRSSSPTPMTPGVGTGGYMPVAH
ncbi:hypothetical protein SLS61_004767 [Didymella pomorum]